MKAIKILLRALFILFALAIFFTGVNVGFIKSSVVAVLFVISGFLMTHPIALSAENLNGSNFESRKIGMFLFGGALFVVAAGLAVSAEFGMAIKIVIAALALVAAGYRFLKMKAN